MKRILNLRTLNAWGLALCLTLTFLLVGGRTAQADSIALAQNVQAGETASFTVEVRNETTNSHTYTPTLAGLTDGLGVSFTQGGPVVEKIDVPAQSADQIVIRVETKPETPVGSYSGLFATTRDDGATTQMALALTVENTYALQITSQSLNLSAFSGQEFTFDLTAVNSGATAISHAALQTEVPGKWIVQTDPAQVDSLAPGASIAFHTRVLVPPSQMAIDQPLKLTVRSDQTSSPDITVIVRVQKSPNFLYGAGALIFLAIAGVFVYFRRKGRR